MELEQILQRLRGARQPKDVFGNGDHKTCQKLYRRLAQQVHPDHNLDQPDLARKVFQLLNEWWDRFLQQSKPQTGPVIITAGRKTYTVTGPLAAGEIADLHYAVDPKGADVILKIVRDPVNNDLLANEQRMLEKIATAGPSEMDVTRPDIIGSFMLDGRKVLVLTRPKVELVSLEDINQAYPRGIDCRDMVWMWKRVLAAVGIAHECGVVHGALLPPHILLDLESHGCHLVGWASAAEVNSKIKLKNLSYTSWYPKDAPTATSGLDLHMLACSMFDAVAPTSVPSSIQRLLTLSMQTPEKRSRSALVLHELLDQVLRETYGPPKFRKFTMPT